METEMKSEAVKRLEDSILRLQDVYARRDSHAAMGEIIRDIAAVILQIEKKVSLLYDRA